MGRFRGYVGNVKRKPFRHQRRVLRDARVRGKSCIALFLEMRLGKCLIFIRWSADLPHPRLIVAPMSAIPDWMRELRAEGFRGVWLRGTPDQRVRTAVQHWDDPTVHMVTNYESLFRPRIRKPTPIVELPWGVVCLDESARIRNPRAIVSRTCVNSLRHASDNRALLCGLPNPNGSLDFVQQMMFLDGKFLGYNNVWKLREDLFWADRFNNWHPKLETRQRIRRAVRKRSVFISREEVGLANKKLRSTRVVELPRAVRAAYKKAESEFEIGDAQTLWRVVVDGWLSRLTGGSHRDFPHDAKTNELVALLQGELKGQSVVVWFRHNREILRVEKRLRMLGVSVRRITGRVPVARRAKRTLNFQRGRVRVLLVQIKCGRYGMNLARASAAVWYSNTPSNDDRMQCEDRIEHPTKREPLLLIDILARDTVDVDLSDTLGARRMSAHAFNRSLFEKWKQRNDA